MGETCYRADFELTGGSVGNSILCLIPQPAEFYQSERRQISNVNLFHSLDLTEHLGRKPQGTLGPMYSKNHVKINGFLSHSLWLPRQEITICSGWSHQVLAVKAHLVCAHVITDTQWHGFFGSFRNALSTADFLQVLLASSGIGSTYPQRKLMKIHTTRPVHLMPWKWYPSIWNLAALWSHSLFHWTASKWPRQCILQKRISLLTC